MCRFTILYLNPQGQMCFRIQNFLEFRKVISACVIYYTKSLGWFWESTLYASTLVFLQGNIWIVMLSRIKAVSTLMLIQPGLAPKCIWALSYDIFFFPELFGILELRLRKSEDWQIDKGQYNLVQIFEKMSCIRKTEIFQYNVGGSETSWGRVQGDRFRLNLKSF